MLAKARESAPTSSLVPSRMSTTSPSSKRLAALASCARRLTTNKRLRAMTTAAKPSPVAEKVISVLRCAAAMVAFSSTKEHAISAAPSNSPDSLTTAFCTMTASAVRSTSSRRGMRTEG